MKTPELSMTPVKKQQATVFAKPANISPKKALSRKPDAGPPVSPPVKPAAQEKQRKPRSSSKRASDSGESGESGSDRKRAGRKPQSAAPQPSANTGRIAQTHDARAVYACSDHHDQAKTATGMTRADYLRGRHFESLHQGEDLAEFWMSCLTFSNQLARQRGDDAAVRTIEASLKRTLKEQGINLPTLSQPKRKDLPKKK